MKKDYISPIAEVIFVHTENMMAATKLNGQEGNSTVGVDFTEGEYDGEGASRRRRSQWDDEDDDF